MSDTVLELVHQTADRAVDQIIDELYRHDFDQLPPSQQEAFRGELVTHVDTWLKGELEVAADVLAREQPCPTAWAEPLDTTERAKALAGKG